MSTPYQNKSQLGDIDEFGRRLEIFFVRITKETTRNK